ncbi:hypothetical protein M5K25_002264 [Dendrobium thyrsiflorum]|uniref:Uncharacterized protein n=1 Tax=Dendrobium thyrsiflorum TaxID=117978 RepID=A0ABD0VSE5_DENTH
MKLDLITRHATRVWKHVCELRCGKQNRESGRGCEIDKLAGCLASQRPLSRAKLIIFYLLRPTSLFFVHSSIYAFSLDEGNYRTLRNRFNLPKAKSCSNLASKQPWLGRSRSINLGIEEINEEDKKYWSYNAKQSIIS